MSICRVRDEFGFVRKRGGEERGGTDLWIHVQLNFHLSRDWAKDVMGVERRRLSADCDEPLELCAELVGRQTVERLCVHVDVHREGFELDELVPDGGLEVLDERRLPLLVSREHCDSLERRTERVSAGRVLRRRTLVPHVDAADRHLEVVDDLRDEPGGEAVRLLVISVLRFCLHRLDQVVLCELRELRLDLRLAPGLFVVHEVGLRPGKKVDVVDEDDHRL